MSKIKSVILKIALFAVAIACIIGVLFAVACTPSETPKDEKISPIKSVYAFGFVDVDGAKIKALAIEYEQDLTGVNITADTYKLTLKDSNAYLQTGDGNVGDITAIYVNSEREISETGGDGKGHYVIAEVFTDYICGSENAVTSAMVARVTQVKDITLADGSVIEKGNTYTANVVTEGKSASLDPDSFEIPELDGWKFYTDENEGGFGKDGDAFLWENCFSQQTGLYEDEHLAYALYLPPNYEQAGGKNGNWGLVTVENPAANKGTHPMVSVLQTRGPTKFASEWGQKFVRDKYGLDGLIVVVPVVTERVNDNGGTPAEYEAIVHLWDHIIDTYGVNENYVYGAGQSVGGMILVETNRNRDNFFAGIMLYANQWGQNYFIDTLFIRDMVANATAAATAEMHYPRTDSSITRNYYLDTDGSEVTNGHDPYNMYYLISDDNICVYTSEGNGMGIDAWNEIHYLYKDTVGSGINRIDVELEGKSIAERNAEVERFLKGETKCPDYNESFTNINVVKLVGSVGGYDARTLDSSYEWLLSQTRTAAVAREKLDINKPFEAVEQIKTDDRKLHFIDGNGADLYFLTAKEGSGTQFYSTSWLNMYTVADNVPGWLPEGMNRTDTPVISGARIVSIHKISPTAIAIEYDKDMENLYVNLKGDAIIGLDGNVREDIAIRLDPYEFFDANGKSISAEISNVYVNSDDSTRSGATRGSGAGNYVIVELKTALTTDPVTVIQRTTLHTDKYIANAMPWTYTFTA